MNKKQLLLADYFDAGRQNRPKKPESKLEHVISQYYQEICEQALKMEVQLDETVEDPCEKVEALSSLVLQLLQERQRKQQCQDCINYQKHLQKLQADVRQHIRLQQQLKLYQDNIEQKNEEAKILNKQLQKELENLKRKAQDNKQLHDKLTKLETQNEQLKAELKNRHRKKEEHNPSAQPTNPPRYDNSLDKPSSSQSQYRKFDSKTTLTEKYPLTRTINFSSNLNVEERKSMDKKPTGQHRLDAQKYRQSLTNKSANMLRPPTDRRRYDEKSAVRDKENERRKTNKIDYRR